MAVLRGWLVLALLATGGCDRVFGLAGGGDDEPPVDAARDGEEPPDIDAPAEHDEDGDGIPDVRDPCPGTPRGEENDGDADGVGDACDPRPAASCNRRIAFLSLDATAAGLVVTPPWLVEDGDLVQSTTVGTPTSTFHLDGTYSFTIHAGVRALQGVAGSRLSVGAGTVGATPASGFACQLVIEPASIALVTHDIGANQDANRETALENSALAAGILTFSLHDNRDAQCAIETSAGTTYSSSSRSLGVTQFAALITTQNAAVRIPWLDIIDDAECP